MLYLNAIKNGNVKDKNISHIWKRFKILSVYIKGMEKAEKYARPIGFRAKNSSKK